jgi:hydroxymethylbilane synthase
MRIATRASALALAQAELVGRTLMEAGAVDAFELVPVVTSGDRGERGEDKSRWVVELEQALLRDDADLAVHSAKDVPGELGEGLALLGAPPRAAAEDVLCGAESLEALPIRARVGTSSLRRSAQLLAAREDLDVVSMRGNVDTRLRKLATGEGGELDAIVLARAALQRLEREPDAGAVLDPARFVPAPGQGTLALEGRSDDTRTREVVGAITDDDTLTCLLAERALSRALGAGCHTPLGAHAVPVGDARLHLRAWVGLPDGARWLLDKQTGERSAPDALGREVARRMTLAGAAELLEEAERAGLGAASRGIGAQR